MVVLDFSHSFRSRQSGYVPSAFYRFVGSANETILPLADYFTCTALQRIGLSRSAHLAKQTQTCRAVSRHLQVGRVMMHRAPSGTSSSTQISPPTRSIT